MNTATTITTTASTAVKSASEELLSNVLVKNVLRNTITIQLNCLRSSIPTAYMPRTLAPLDIRKVSETVKDQKLINNKFYVPVNHTNNSRYIRPNSNTSQYTTKLHPNRKYSFCTNNISNNKLKFNSWFFKQFCTSKKRINDNSISFVKHLNISDHMEYLKLLTNNYNFSLDKLSSNMNNQSFNEEENIIEFNSTINWEEKVLQSNYPVVIDCYADWCNPCIKLKPVLTQRYLSMKCFRLIKINIDDNPELTENLNISSIPSVFLIYKGNVIDQFNGYPNNNRLDEFFNNINLLKSLGNDEELFQGLLYGADEFMKKGDYDQAENMLNEAFSHESMRKRYGYLIKLGLAITNFNKKDYSKAKGFVNDVLEFHKNDINKDNKAAKKLSIIDVQCYIREFYKDTDIHKEHSMDSLVDRININPSDVESRYILSLYFIANEDYENACINLLEIIKIDRNWENKKAHNLLLKLFSMLGSNSDIAINSRKELVKILY